MSLLFLLIRYTKNALVAGDLPRTPLGELTVLPRSPSWIRGAASRRKERNGWEEGGRKGKKKKDMQTG